MTEKKKRTFIAYADWLNYFDEDTTFEEMGKLFYAILLYQNGDKDARPDDPGLKYVFNKIKSTMEADAEKHAEVSAKRAEAAKAKAEMQKSAKSANADKCTQKHPDTDTETETDTETDTENVSPNGDKRERKAASRFRPPSVEEVEAYCFERNNKVDPERFVDFYSSNGWKVGKNPMKDWKAAVRTWEKRDGPNNVVEMTNGQKARQAQNDVLKAMYQGIL